MDGTAHVIRWPTNRRIPTQSMANAHTFWTYRFIHLCVYVCKYRQFAWAQIDKNLHTHIIMKFRQNCFMVNLQQCKKCKQHKLWIEEEHTNPRTRTNSTTIFIIISDKRRAVQGAGLHAANAHENICTERRPMMTTEKNFHIAATGAAYAYIVFVEKNTTGIFC